MTVFDEPPAALDAHAEDEIFTRAARVARSGKQRGSITLLVTHRYSTVRAADLIVVLDDGRIVERGSHDELMAKGGTYARLYRTQAAGYLH